MSSFLMESFGMSEFNNGDVNSFSFEFATLSNSREHSGDCTRRHNCLIPSTLMRNGWSQCKVV